MALGRGMLVIAIAGAGALEPLRRLGAKVAVDHRTAWRRSLAEAAPRGVEAALDLVGSESLARALDLVRDGGRFVTTVRGAAQIGVPQGISIRFLPMRSSLGALDAMRTRDRAPGDFVLLS